MEESTPVLAPRKARNINDRCGNSRCPMRFTCALDLEADPEFDIEERCQMGWREPVDKTAVKPRPKRRFTNAKKKK